MKKSTTLALAGLMAVSAAANASMSRWNGFGNANAFIADVQDIWTLPGVVAGNKNAVYYELGDANGNFGDGDDGDANADAAGSYNGLAWGGVHSEVGPGVLGVWFNRGTAGSIIGGGLSNFGLGSTGAILPGLAGSIGGNSGNIGATINNLGQPSSARVDILYGFDVNEKLGLGVSVSRGNVSTKREVAAPTSTTVFYDATALGFGLGAEIKELAFIKLLELGLIFESESALLSGKNNAGEDKLSAAGTGFGIRIGADMAGENGKFSRAEINFTTSSGEAKNEAANGAAAAGGNSNKGGQSNWNIGYAMGGTKDKGMGLMGLRLLGMGSSNETDAANSKSENSGMNLELSVAGEGKVKDWLTARAGMHGNLWQSAGFKNSAAASAVTTSDTFNNGTTVSAGLTATFGDIAIDGVLNQDILYTGGFLISGVGDALSTQISTTWSW